MKISYRTHPALAFLKTGGLKGVKIADSDILHFNRRVGKNNIYNIWDRNVDMFSSNIRVITKPFAEAVSLSLDKMLSQELIEEIGKKNHWGTLVYGRVVQMFSLVNNVDLFSIFTFQDDYIIYCLVGGGNNDTNISFFSEEYYKYALGNFYSYEFVIPSEVQSLIAKLNFIKYAQVETKYLAAGKKITDVNCKYKNETNSNITILDSKWFTTLVKSDGFKVRGHFRLQPKKKDGVWTKELIWINEFEKSGYTAPARKLAQL